MSIISRLFVPKIRFPFYLRPIRSDILTFHQTFTLKEYDIEIDIDPAFIIDAGANIGVSAVYFANRFPGARIISIEPERYNYELLIKNTSSYENVIPMHSALFNKECELQIITKGYSECGFMISESTNQSSENECVKSTTVEQIIMKYNVKSIDIFKIDIEGSEKELFESNYENWLPMVKYLIIELHDNKRPGGSKNFFNAINKFDFSLRQRGENLIFINNLVN